jgi:phosphopantothenate synthetase
MGIMPAQLAIKGHVGVISRSGTLTYEVVDELTRALPNIARACREISPRESERLMRIPEKTYFLRAALDTMRGNLEHALD